MNPIAKVQQALGLTDSELATLFGVDAEEVARWLALPAPMTGTVQEWVAASIPQEHQERLLATVELVELLAHGLRADLPDVVRRPAAAYGDLSILEMLTAGRHTEVLESVRRSFDFEIGHAHFRAPNPPDEPLTTEWDRLRLTDRVHWCIPPNVPGQGTCRGCGELWPCAYAATHARTRGKQP